MYESNSANGGSPPQGESGAPPPGSGDTASRDGEERAGSTVRLWVSGLMFFALAVVTFIAGEDNRWVSVPAAILATVALVDFIWVSQRRRRTPD